MGLFKGFIQTQKNVLKELIAIWKPALALDFIVAIISYITGWKFDTVLFWTMGIIVGAVMSAALYTIGFYLWEKKKEE